jgi:hypothetical protein
MRGFGKVVVWSTTADFSWDNAVGPILTVERPSTLPEETRWTAPRVLWKNRS